jgi:hypothetical protein
MNSAAILQSQTIAEPPKPGKPEYVPEVLRVWLKDRTELSFVYSRSMGGFIETGRAWLTGMD